MTTNNAAKPPDGGWGWVVMLASFFNHVAFLAALKSGGVMYVAMMENGISRTQAAFIPGLAFSITCLLGPVSTSIGLSRFGIRNIVFLAGLISSLGMVLASFSIASPTAMTITYGAVVGVGCGLGLIPSLIFVHTYFLKHRAFASSFALAGGAGGALIMPPLAEYIYEQHGIRATFLAMAAVLLHVCPAALLFRPLKKTNIPELEPGQPASNGNITIAAPADTIQDGERHGSLEARLNPADECNGNPKIQDATNKEEMSLLLKRRRSVSAVTNTPKTDDKPSDDSSRCSQICSKLSGWMAVVHIDSSIFTDKHFLLVAYSLFSFSLIWPAYFTLLPDFAYTETEDEVTRNMAATLVSVMSFGDVTFRVVFGWVSDRQWLQRKHYYLIFNSICSVTLICYSFTNTYNLFVANSVLFGIFVSGAIVLPPVLLNDFLGPERFPMAYGICSFVNSFAMLGSAPLFAYVRIITGSYKHCFVIMGCLFLGSAMAWVINEIVIIVRERRITQQESNGSV